MVGATTARAARTRTRRIDPSMGERIRALRQARGMTQAQLAGDDFTKGFISLLETGRTHASLRAAGILAGRLDIPIGELMVAHGRPAEAELEFTLIRAEQELAAGRAQVAAEAAAALQPKTSGLLRARAKRLRARALIESTRSREAIQLLDGARRE